MKRALLYIGIALATIGCTKDADVDTPSGDNALTFTSNIATRADKSAWVGGDAIGVYMTTGATLGDGGANKEYTTTGDGKFSSTDPLYLPTSGSAKILAYYPYDNFKDGGTINAYPITSSEQVDILRATDDDVSSSNVSLSFNHLLSKVSLTIEAGTGVSLADLDALVVTISGIYTEGTFDLENGAVNGGDLSGNSTPLQFDTSITRDDDSVTAISSSAIVIPQSLSDADATLFFTTSGDDSKTYSTTIPAKAFGTGLEYIYTITIKESEVEITSATINKWGDGKETSGIADIVDIEYKSDGKYHINSAKGLAAFSDLVNGVENTTAIYAGFENDTENGGDSGVSFGTSYTEIQGVLTRNIDLSDVYDTDNDGTSDTNWTPIGKSSTTMFVGTFNGGGYTVSGLYISGGSKLGLFGYLDENGLVYNVGVKGTITTTSAESAGIVSYNYGWVMNSYSEVTLDGGVNTAGIAGYNEGNVVNCYNLGDVKGTNNVGGIVGQNAAGGYVGYSFSVGDVSGTTRVGGIVGWNYTTTDTAPTIKGCFCLDLDGDDYSIGQLEYVASSGSSTANMYDKDYLTSEVFAVLMNNGAYTYNYYNENLDSDNNRVHTESPVNACVWVNNSKSSDYPTLDVSDTNPIYNDTVYDIVYNGGTYEIYTAAGLKAFAKLVNEGGITTDDGFVTSGNFATYYAVTTSARSSINGQLMDDIDLKSEAWTPIGDYSGSSVTYSGTFDGNGKFVSNMSVSGVYDAGLFGYTNSFATISNLGVSGTVKGNTPGDSACGGVVGENWGAVINCYATLSYDSSENSNSAYAGGVVGYNKGTITNCFSSGKVAGYNIAGGVVGTNSDGVIINCYSSATVSGNASNVVGGVAGYNSGAITLCYWDSSISGSDVTVGVNDATGGYSNVTDYNDNGVTMQSTSFITLLNSNAYTYNNPTEGGKPTVTACAWEEVTDGYPTLSFGVDPGITYSKLSDFSAESYPAGNIWYIIDTDADATADEASEFEGLEKALEVANTSGNITVIFSNLETLPSEAFRSCTYLTSISLPSATTIGKNALRYCTALTSVSLPSAKEIGECAFYGSTSLTSISLPSATEIKENAFTGCTSLISATLPSATEIGDSVFKSCGSLTSIELPSATEIGGYAFSLCEKLTTLDLGSSGNGISSIGSGAFYKDTNATIAGDIDLTIKIASESTTVSVGGDDGKTLTYGATGNSTTVFKSITEITNLALND